MFVLDALRPIKRGKLTIPSFHLGHLGFRPGLVVDAQHVAFNDGREHELTITPFQASRDDLFIFKCIFKEQAGVVARALSAFASMHLNVLSLESATIDRDTKHVLFCILSWAPSHHPNRIPLDDGTKHKYVDMLPLLPVLDKRYIYFLEAFFLFCFDALEYEAVPEQVHCLPRVSIKLFDDFYSRDRNWKPLEVSRRRANLPSGKVKVSLPSVYVDVGRATGAKKSARALLFSETETKSLHIIFRQPDRERLFLHVGFTHDNRPGALLLIAKLLQHCDFSIKTSLLRQYDTREVNVWEAMLEYVGNVPIGHIPSEGTKGIEWFREWCFGCNNPKREMARELIGYLRKYRVEICRPSYPRRSTDRDANFVPIKLLEGASVRRGSSKQTNEIFEVALYEYAARLAHLERAREEGPPEYGWLAKLIKFPMLERKHTGGQVFLSIPKHCEHRKKLVTKLQSVLDVEVIAYLQGDASDSLSTAALDMIRSADFFLGVWHPEQRRKKSLSPWLPFEFGAALALGKPWIVIAHSDVPSHLTRRIKQDYALIEYGDTRFEKVFTKLIPACKRIWQRPTGALKGQVPLAFPDQR
jgi:hypothetical protein